MKQRGVMERMLEPLGLPTSREGDALSVRPRNAKDEGLTRAPDGRVWELLAPLADGVRWRARVAVGDDGDEKWRVDIRAPASEEEHESWVRVETTPADAPLARGLVVGESLRVRFDVSFVLGGERIERTAFEFTTRVPERLVSYGGCPTHPVVLSERAWASLSFMREREKPGDAESYPLVLTHIEARFNCDEDPWSQ